MGEYYRVRKKDALMENGIIVKVSNDKILNRTGSSEILAKYGCGFSSEGVFEVGSDFLARRMSTREAYLFELDKDNYWERFKEWN